MTTNQIEYAKLLENRRNNMAVHNENVRSHKANEAHQAAVLGETVRSNKAREYETNRANLANEALKGEQLQINWYNLEELQRSNAAREEETNRANLANEWLKEEANAIGWAQIDETARANEAREEYNRAQIQLGWSQLYETERANLAREAETERTNRENEAIRQQANQITSDLGWGNIDVSTERNRIQSDLGWANVDLGWANLAATQERNQIARETLEEQIRHNQWMTGSQFLSSLGSLLSGTARYRESIPDYDFILGGSSNGEENWQQPITVTVNNEIPWYQGQTQQLQGSSGGQARLGSGAGRSTYQYSQGGQTHGGGAGRRV